MFAGFIAQLRASGVPASLTEYLTLLRAMKEGCADYSVESFYFLARSALVKDERLIDRFDRVFAHFFRGLGNVDAEIMADLPAEWLKKKPATSELIDWLKLLMADEIPLTALRSNDPKVVIPPLHGALLKNEQDVHLFERLAFLHRRGQA